MLHSNIKTVSLQNLSVYWLPDGGNTVDEKRLFYLTHVPARPATYIIKAECDGYETKCINHTIKYIARNKDFSFPSLLLKKKFNQDVALDDVVVTGTKVKLAYRGDTLVFNASAFNVPDGSMLDALIRQMPGAELKSNGDIYVNGKKIDYLLLNGKDFFKGKNQVMLDNLPYYTVKELKVYDRSSEKSRLMGKLPGSSLRTLLHRQFTNLGIWQPE